MEKTFYLKLITQLKKDYGKEHIIFSTWNLKNIYVLKAFKYMIIIKLNKNNSYVTSYAIGEILGGIVGAIGEKRTLAKLSKVEENIKNILRENGLKVTDISLSNKGV